MLEMKFRAWDKRRNWMLYDGDSCGYIEKEKHEVDVVNLILSEGYHEDLTFLQYTGLKDMDGTEIYKGDITELEVDGDIRRFVANIKTVIREVVSHPNFDGDTAKVAITGVVFEWNGFELFPCVDANGIPDNEKMVVVGNIYEDMELLAE